LVKQLLPEPSGDGRPEKHPRREIVNAILYLVRSGCPWRCLPADLPPWQTVYWYFVRWEDAGVTEKLLAALPVTARVAQGREPEPSAGVLDSQSVKGADTVGRTPAVTTRVKGTVALSDPRARAPQILRRALTDGQLYWPSRWPQPTTLPDLCRSPDRREWISQGALRQAILRMAQRNRASECHLAHEVA
jgi:transposase